MLASWFAGRRSIACKGDDRPYSVAHPRAVVLAQCDRLHGCVRCSRAAHTHTALQGRHCTLTAHWPRCQAVLPSCDAKLCAAQPRAATAVRRAATAVLCVHHRAAKLLQACTTVPLSAAEAANHRRSRRICRALAATCGPVPSSCCMGDGACGATAFAQPWRGSSPRSDSTHGTRMVGCEGGGHCGAPQINWSARRRGDDTCMRDNYRVRS